MKICKTVAAKDKHTAKDKYTTIISSLLFAYFLLVSVAGYAQKGQ
jgi:hypothetical protein